MTLFYAIEGDPYEMKMVPMKVFDVDDPHKIDVKDHHPYKIV